MGIFGNIDPTGAVGGALNIIGQKMQSNADWKSLQAQNKWNKEAAAKQFEYDTTAWERQTAYNSPQQVMERYKAAGLNPNLIYGGGMGNTAGTVPSQKVPDQSMRARQPVQLGNVLGAFQDTRLKQVETNNAIKQGELLDKQKIIKAAEANAAVNYYGGRGKHSYSKGQEGLQRWSWLQEIGDTGSSRGYEMMQTQQDLKATEINSKLKRILLIDQDIDLKKKMNEYYDFGQLMKLAGPAVGIVNKFAKRGNAAVKAAPTVKGVSSKFTTPASKVSKQAFTDWKNNSAYRNYTFKNTFE